MQRQAKTSDNISAKALEEAADWLVRIQSGVLAEHDQDAFMKWQQSSPENMAAWNKAESLLDKLGSVPPKLAMQSLMRPVDSERRNTLGKLLLLLLAVPTGWGSWKLATSQGETVQYRSATGERINIKLGDGSKLSLNTQTEIDVHFNDRQRVVILHKGEIHVETAKDNASQQRPFLVVSQQGSLQALGTRFNVRQYAEKTEISVFEGAVRLSPELKDKAKIVKAGQQTSFTDTSIKQVKVLSQNQAGWLQGMIFADNMRLADLINELARYHSTGLRCDPAVADLRVAGSFPVTDIEQSLNMLVTTYPVTIVSRMGRYWITSPPG